MKGPFAAALRGRGYQYNFRGSARSETYRSTTESTYHSLSNLESILGGFWAVAVRTLCSFIGIDCTVDCTLEMNAPGKPADPTVLELAIAPPSAVEESVGFAALRECFADPLISFKKNCVDRTFKGIMLEGGSVIRG